MRDDRERLTDILKAIDRISGKTIRGRRAFDEDELLQVWVLRHLQIIGEAAPCLSEDFQRSHPYQVCSKAAGMRHILVHHHFEIDASQIWKVVEHDLGPLLDRVASILASLGPEDQIKPVSER
jgi:uncharacterized protein with HEPN domain